MSDNGVKKVRCPSCRETFMLPAVTRSSTVKCPHCKNLLKTSSERQESVDPLIGKRVAGYLIGQRLGRGSMGRVYLAHNDDGEEFAFKLLSTKVREDSELLERFQREARLSCKLRHPNLVAGYEFGEEHKAFYLVMEYARGTPLDTMIDRRGRLDWEQAADILRQIADALGYLVEQGVIHRDVKPENMMVADDGQAKLLDMGFAKTIGGGDLAKDEMQELTMVGTALGSPAYMAPEQVLDSSRAEAPTDVYCLGASFYHALTGKLPFDGRTAVAVMEKVLHDDLVPPREVCEDIPAGLEALICWAMAKDPRKRPRDCRFFHELIVSCLEAPHDAKRIKRLAQGGRRGMLILLLVLLVLVAAGAYWYVFRRGG